MPLSKPVQKKNMTLRDRCAAMEAAETLNKTGSLEVDGTQITEFKDIAAHFQVGKPLISKLKNMSSAEKEKL